MASESLYPPVPRSNTFSQVTTEVTLTTISMVHPAVPLEPGTQMMGSARPMELGPLTCVRST